MDLEFSELDSGFKKSDWVVSVNRVTAQFQTGHVWNEKAVYFHEDDGTILFVRQNFASLGFALRDITLISRKML